MGKVPLTAERRHRAGLVGIALGLTLALWAKPNAVLAVGAWLGAFALLRAAGRPALLLALATALAVGAIPYLLIIKEYGALVPVTVEQFGNVRQLDSFSSYLPAASFRYYLPLWPPLAHALAYGVMAARRPGVRLALASVSLIALAVGWVSP